MEYEDDNNSDLNEYDSDYEKKKIDQMDKEITDLLKNHKEYFINTGSETKDGEKERKREREKEVGKCKRNLEIQAEFANKPELKRYSNEETEQSDSDDESSDYDFTDICMFNLYLYF